MRQLRLGPRRGRDEKKRLNARIVYSAAQNGRASGWNGQNTSMPDDTSACGRYPILSSPQSISCAECRRPVRTLQFKHDRHAGYVKCMGLFRRAML